MSSYSPPYEDVAIFDTIYFSAGDEYITQNQADKRYLRYPNAQGTENLQAINVNGLATFNADIVVADGAESTTISQDATTNAFTISNGVNTGTILLQVKDSGGITNNVMSINATTLNLGVTNSGIINAGLLNLNLNSTGLEVNKPLRMDGAANTDRIINNVYYQLQDQNALTTTTGQIYASSGVFNYDNDANGGTHTFAVNTAGGVQTIPFSFNAVDMNIQTTNPPNCSATQPAFTDSSTKIPTTAWVQGAIKAAATDEFAYTTAGTYTLSVPSGYGTLRIICIGAGGGGGGGADMGAPAGGDKGATGGAGGGGGGITIVEIQLTGQTSFTIVVGAGGNGGAAGAYPNNASAGAAGGTSYVSSGGLYYAYSTGGGGGAGALNQVAAASLTQPSGGAGGTGSQGIGGAGGKGVGLNSPSTYNTGFVFTGTQGSQSALIGAGGGGGGGAIYETPGSGGGNVYIDSDGQNGGALGYTLSQTILQGEGIGGKASGGGPAWQNPTSGSTAIRGVGGGGGGGGFASAFSGSSPPAAGGAAGGAGSGGGGGGSDHNFGSTGGRGGDGVVLMFFS